MHSAAPNFWLDVHDGKQLDPGGSHSRVQAKLRLAPCVCARGQIANADRTDARQARSTKGISIKVVFLRFFRAFCPPASLAEGSSGPAAGYSGLANPSSQLTVCCEKPPTHVHRQSLGREPGRAAVVPGINERIERIGLSWRLFAIRKFRVAYNNENLKSK